MRKVFWVLGFVSFLAQAADPTNFIGSGRIHEWARGICTSFKKMGQCESGPGKPPIALVAYDPKSFSMPNGQLIGPDQLYSSFPADADCYVLKESLQKNYCIEGIPLEDSNQLKYLLAKVPSLKMRYQYLANVTHGTSGAWILHSACDVIVEKACRPSGIADMGKVANCQDQAKSSEQLKDVCPCYKSYGLALQAGVKLEDAGQKASMKDLVELQKSQKQAERDYKTCTQDPKNVDFYTEEQDPAVFAAMARLGATVYSVSCSTNTGDKESQRFRDRMCAKAPMGLRFNMAKTVTAAACAISSDAAKLRDRLQLAAQCAEGKCSIAEAEKADQDLQKAFHAEARVTEPTRGNFDCYTCRRGVAEPSKCNTFEFPKSTNPNSGPIEPPSDDSDSPLRYHDAPKH